MEWLGDTSMVGMDWNSRDLGGAFDIGVPRIHILKWTCER
jgi:hypothetical protein